MANRVQTVTQHMPSWLIPMVITMERGSSKVVVHREDSAGRVALVAVALDGTRMTRA